MVSSTGDLPVRTVPLAGLPGRACPAAAALELVGERWSLLIVRELLLGQRRFTDIVHGTGAPRDRVTVRLRSLEQAGLVARRPYQDAPPREEYLLTEAGRALRPVVHNLLSWGRQYAVAADDPLREASSRTRCDPATTHGSDGRLEQPGGPGLSRRDVDG